MGYPAAAGPDRVGFDVILPWQRPPLMANETARGNNRAHARLRGEVRSDTGILLRSLALPRFERAMVFLIWYMGRNASMADSDNIAPTLKPCIDALRDAKIIPQDTGDRVVLSGQRVIPLKEDPYASKVPRLILSVVDATAQALPHFKPGAACTLTSQAAMF